MSEQHTKDAYPQFEDRDLEFAFDSAMESGAWERARDLAREMRRRGLNLSTSDYADAMIEHRI